MRKKIVIFGLRDLAELAAFYIEKEHSNEMEVVAFCVDKEFLTIQNFMNKPVIALETIAELYPPNNHKFFVPMTQKKMGAVRKSKYMQIKNLGYELINLISPKATVYGQVLGDNNFIFEDNTIQPFVTIGSNNIFWSGNHIGHHSQILDDNFITSHVVISGHCCLKSRCYLGVNSTIRDGITLAEASLIGMGAVIGTNTEPFQIYTVANARHREHHRSEDVL